MKQPTFFIIGAPKCGTTSLAAWLAAHPRVYMSSVKEPNYYSRDLEMKGRPAKSAAEYYRLFHDAPDSSLAIGEASVSYLYSQQAVSTIMAEAPGSKFIVCLRNPVEMAYSLHTQALRTGNEHIADFEQAWNAQARRMRGEDISRYCREPWMLMYGPVCSLGAQIARLYATADRSVVFPILIDQLQADPTAAYCSVLEFLGVPDDGRRDFPVLNPSTAWRSPVVGRAVKGIRLIKRALRIPDLGTPVLAFVDKLNRNKDARPPLGAAMRARLQEYFSADVLLLEELLQRDLSHWRRPDA